MINYQITQKTASDVQFSVQLDEEYLKPLKKAALDKLKTRLKIPGFREGKLPDALAEREIGDSRLQAEVIETAIHKSYLETIDKLKLDIISQPEIQVRKFVPYTQIEYQCEVAVMPKIQFNYKKIRITPLKPKISQKDIEATIESLRYQMAEKKPVSRKAKRGDELTIDFIGEHAGKPIESASASDQRVLIDKDQFIPGFEANLIGLKTGDKKEFAIDFPPDYIRPDLAGKKVIFKVKVKQVKEVKLPKLDNQLAKKAGNFPDLAALKENVRLKLLQSQQDYLEKKYRDEVISKVIENVKIDLPQILVNNQLSRLKVEVEENLRNSGLDKTKYLQIQGKTEEQLNQELMQEATKRVKLALVIKYLIAQENLQVQPAELEQEIARLKKRYPDLETQKKLERSTFRAELVNHLLSEKAIQTLINYAKGGK